MPSTFPGENLLRELTPQVLTLLARRIGDFSATEDAVQEALAAAWSQWPTQGTPANPKAWLIHVAERRFEDQRRSDVARRAREEVVTSGTDEASIPSLDGGSNEREDTLVLLFMCSHPALTRSSAIALTLRAVGGLTTAEIARAFLVPEATMAQRISRAKETIRDSGTLFRMPTDRERSERLGAVLHVLYLIFNEGYSATMGADLQRNDLANEAIRLAREVHRLLPNDGEIAGLLALMLLTDARRDARTGPDGEIVPLEEQDRGRWDRAEITEGAALIQGTIARGSVGAYQIQAAIAALHDDAARFEDTDWPQILGLYTLLERMSDNPMITLNRAIAEAMVHGPAAGLKALETVDRDKRIAGTHRLDAVRAHLFEMLGDRDAAVSHYQSAADRTTSIPERNYLIGRAGRLSTSAK